MSSALLCCEAEGINPNFVCLSSWRGEANVPVASPELQEQEEIPTYWLFCYSILLPKHGVVLAGSISLMVPSVTEMCRCPYRGTADGGRRGTGGHRKGAGCHSKGFIKPLKVSL